MFPGDLPADTVPGMSSASRARYDVVVVGGGHNGLTAAAYLAGAGLSVLVLERLGHTGGAAVSARGVPRARARGCRATPTWSRCCPSRSSATWSSTSSCARARTASYSPTVRDGRHLGLLRRARRGRGDAGVVPRADRLRRRVRRLARLLRGGGRPRRRRRADPDLDPCPPRRRAARAGGRARSGTRSSSDPLGEVIEQRFADDLVRGVVATDALIGTFADLHDASLVQNRCFLYHLIGNGTGEWRVPVGGMGAVTDGAARRRPRSAGAEVLTGAGGERHPGRRGRRRGHLARRRRHPHGAGAARCCPTWRPWMLQRPARRGAAARPKPAGLAAEDQLPALPAPPAPERRTTRSRRSPARCTWPRSTPP